MATRKGSAKKTSATKPGATSATTKSAVKKAATQPAGQKSSTAKRAVTKHSARKESPEATKPSSPSRKASDAVDRQLLTYRSMRDFNVTQEPSGGSAAPATKLPFVIQKHAASHLHYDFRLGWNGVLKSWAVAKGPSYVTKDKRLAVQVEDHPIEYGGFEGIIPKGQYGGGTVLLWDQGTWEPQPGHEDVDAGLKEGSLKFVMYGEKMKGKWALIRMGGHAANESKPNWLLIKEHDEFERPPGNSPITEEKPKSVVTGRSLEEIARDSDHEWNSKSSPGVAPTGIQTGNASPRKRTSAPQPVKSEKKPSTSGPRQPNLKAYPTEKLPEFISPQLAVEATSASDSAGWIHEIKLDGYRIQANKSGDQVWLRTRSGLDWTHRMQPIAAAVKSIAAHQAVLDGEVVALDENGLSSFANLQAAFQEGAKFELTYFVFDLLHLNGHNLRSAPLGERKQRLAEVVGDAIPELRVSEHIEGNGAKMFQGACDLHAEGIISKRIAGVYRSGRSSDWVKVKCKREQELVIGGFTLPSNGIRGVGALLLGYYDDHRHLIYAGRTGTGFTQKIHAMLRDRLEELTSKSCPFQAVPRAEQRGVKWVKPSLVAQVSFATWTGEGLVRQAAFKGLREDKPAIEVRREDAVMKKVGEPSVSLQKVAAGKKTPSQTAAKTLSKKAGSPGTQHPPVRLTHPDKVLDVDSGMTKQQLADYYWAVAKVMLAEISDRPLSLVRCPEGSGKPCFFQKHTSNTLPPGVETVQVPDKKTGKPEPYITISTPEALAGLAQMGVLEIHPWGSRNEDLEHPDRIIFDLDPDSEIPWSTLAESADELRRLLKKLGIESYLKSTGGKGLHILAPIVAEHDWPAIKAFTHSVALHLEKKQPNLYLTKMSKAARKGKIFIDYLRNERGSTAVAVYSPRAREGAPVSVPLEWKELKLAERPWFAVTNFEEWRSRLKKAIWKDFETRRQRLDLSAVDSL